MVTEREFRKMIRGKRVWVQAQDFNYEILLSFREAVAFFNLKGEYMSWFIEGKDIFLQRNKDR